MTEEQVEQWKQEKWALKTNLDDALDLIDAYKKRVVELEKQNKELEKRCNELFFQVNEQAEQIKKMKAII